ncbi:MAG: hypothetical protein Kow0069_16120 [Promethearchaeota archaeon]
MSTKWPDQKTRTRLDKTIVESSFQPFGLSTYVMDKPVIDFVGRKKELATFKGLIHLVRQHDVSRAIQLSGPAGVGKSTLFAYLMETIEKERDKKEGLVDFLTPNTDIFTTYFQIPSKIVEFSDIWRPMLEGLRACFEKELGKSADVSLVEYVAAHVVRDFLAHDPEALIKIIWGNEGGLVNPETTMRLFTRGRSTLPVVFLPSNLFNGHFKQF